LGNDLDLDANLMFGIGKRQLKMAQNAAAAESLTQMRDGVRGESRTSRTVAMSIRVGIRRSESAFSVQKPPPKKRRVSQFACHKLGGQQGVARWGIVQGGDKGGTLNACNHKFTLIKRFGEQSASNEQLQQQRWRQRQRAE